MVSIKISEVGNPSDFIDSLKKKFGIKYKIFQELIEKGARENIIIFQNDLISLDLTENKIEYVNNDAIIAIIETANKGEGIESNESQLLKNLKNFNCRIGFLCNFEEIICYFYNPDWSLNNGSHHNSENVDDLSDFLIEFIENSKNISIKTSPEEFIKELEHAIENLTKWTSKIPGIEWAKILKFSDFPEKTAIEKKLGTAEKAERNRFSQKSAAYIGIAQILFYVTFRQFRLDKGINKDPELAPLSTTNGIPARVQDILGEIPNHNLNFKTFFGQNLNIFDKLDELAATVINNIARTLEGLSAEYVIRNDLIGQIFQRLMPEPIRKKYAAYYTKRKSAEFLAGLSITSKDEVVFDPSCGSGTLLLYAYHRLQDLGVTQHEQILQQIYGSDVSDVASMMSTLNLAIRDPSNWINSVNIYPHDILDLVGSGIERFFPIKVSNANDKTKKVKNKLPSIDVLIGNPPFTRCMRVSAQYRTRLLELSLVTKYKLKPNFKALGLYAFFLLIGPTLVKKDGGKIAFILPTGAITSEGMTKIWEILFNEGFGIKLLIWASLIDQAFSDSDGQEIIVILEKAYKDSAKLVRLKGHLIEKDIPTLIANISDSNDPIGQNNDFNYLIWDQTTIQSKTCRDWNVFSSIFIRLLYDKFVPISDLSSTISIITQNQSRPADYWFIPNKFWIIEFEDTNSITIAPTSQNRVITKSNTPNKKITLPRDGFVKCLERTISKYNDYPAIIPSGIHKSLYILDENKAGFEDYKLWGQKAHETTLFKSSSHSSSTPALNKIGILQKVFFLGSKTIALRFLEPAMGAGVIMFGFNSDDDKIIDLLFAYLTSSLFLLDALSKARERAGSYVRIHKVDVEKRFKFPNLIKIVKDSVATHMLIQCSQEFNLDKTLNKRPFFDVMIKEARLNRGDLLRKLDEAWFSVLGLSLTTIDLFYQEILNTLIQYDDISKVSAKKPKNIESEEEEGGAVEKEEEEEEDVEGEDAKEE